MKNQAFLVGLTFLLLSCLLAGCSVDQEIHDVVVTDLSTTQQELQSIQAELDGIQTELKATKDELAAKENEIESAESEIASLEAEKSILIAEKEALQADCNQLNNRNTTLTRELAEINMSYHSVCQELGDLQVVYPPRHFSNLRELKSWVSSNAISETPVHESLLLTYDAYVRALEIQEAALRDGYIVSVAVYAHNFYLWSAQQIYCAASVDDGFYYWLPDRDDIKPFALIITEYHTLFSVDPIQIEPILEYQWFEE